MSIFRKIYIVIRLSEYMANEAVVVESPSIIRDFTVADGTGIEQGTICQLSSDPRTATASDGTNVFAGVAMTEKEASDGSTELGLAQDGIFDMTCASGGCTLGAMVVLSGANLIKDAVAAELLTGAIIGKALETGAASEEVEVMVGAN